MKKLFSLILVCLILMPTLLACADPASEPISMLREGAYPHGKASAVFSA